MMSGMLLLELRHASLRWLNLLTCITGRHGRHFEKGTWMRSTCVGVVSGLLKATSAGHHSDRLDRPLMHLDRAVQLTFLASSRCGTGCAIGDRVCGLMADVEL